MIALQRTAGVVGVTLSIIGLLTCVAGAVGVWTIKQRLNVATDAVFSAADDAFDFMATRLDKAEERIASAHRQFGDLAAKAERWHAEHATSAPATQNDSDNEPEKWNLDGVVSELKAAETWLDSIEAVSRGVHAAADRIAESRSSESGDAGATAERVAELASELTDVIAKIDTIRARLLEVRDKRLAAREFTTMLIAQAADLDTRFEALLKRTTDFDARVVSARHRAHASRERTRRWITIGSIATTAALLWFGFSQVCVLNRAWRLAKPHDIAMR